MKRMSVTYSEPSYIYADPAVTALSETRHTTLAPAALVALNHLVDELLHLVVHAALHSTPSPAISTDSSAGGGVSTQPPTPLGADEVLTTDRFKSALARILGPTSLAKECILEAELAVRELVRRGSPSLRGDGALKRAQAWGSPILPSSARARGTPEADKKELVRQAGEVFRALRAWTMQISALGVAAPHGGTAASLQEDLVALMPPRPAPIDSPHLTFLLALYVERVLTALGAHLLRLVSGVAARSATADVAGVADVETALMEDTLVWSWLQGMRVRTLIADESARERARAARGSPVLAQSALPRRSVSGAAGMASTGSVPVALSASAAGLARKPSLAGSTAASSGGTRRPSADSMLSGSTARGGVYPRKNSSSQGLGILPGAPGASSAPPVDDGAFDQLLNSGRTLKLSSTPDRLRNFENRANRPPGANPAAVDLTPTKDASGRRLHARDPQPHGLFAEEDEDAALAATDAERAHKNSFMALLNSGPPEPGVPTSRRASVVPRRPVPTDDPSHPMSVAMRVQDSQNSAKTVESAASDDYALGSPNSRAKALKAKDEKRDLASQVNHDLVDFFVNAPPPAPPRSDRFSAAFDDAQPRAPISPKKSRGGLRGLVSLVTGGGSSSSSSSPKKDAEVRTSLDPPPSYRPRVEGSSAHAAPITSVNQAALRAAGFGESDRGAADWRRRSESVASGYSALPDENPLTRKGSKSQRKLQPTNGHELVGAAAGGASSAITSANGHAGMAPPIPPVPLGENGTPGSAMVKPPQRSSSLKRSMRERELSAVTEASLASSTAAPVSVRSREASAGSASSRQLFEVESAAPPVMVVPAGVVGGTVSGPPSLDSHEAALPSGMPAAPPVDRAATLAAAEPSAAAAALAPVLAAGAAKALHHDAAAPVDGFAQAMPLSPVQELPTPPADATSVAVAPAGPQDSTVPQSSSPLPSTSPAVLGHLTTATLGGAKSIVALLKELRGAMLFAQNRGECVDLVEGMLRDQARRVEALAQREREEGVGQNHEGGVKERDCAQVGPEWREEGEQAAVAEALLGGEPAAGHDAPTVNGHADVDASVDAPAAPDAEPAVTHSPIQVAA